MQLRPCVQCRRHVALFEKRCPFCATALVPARAQHVTIAGRVTRAAVFSAALAACSNEKAQSPAPASPPQPTSGTPGDASAAAVIDAPSPVDARIEDAVVAVDAAVTPDAGVTRKQQRRKQRQNEQLKIEESPVDILPPAKPYGAPPARRRIV